MPYPPNSQVTHHNLISLGDPYYTVVCIWYAAKMPISPTRSELIVVNQPSARRLPSFQIREMNGNWTINRVNRMHSSYAFPRFPASVGDRQAQQRGLLIGRAAAVPKGYAKVREKFYRRLQYIRASLSFAGRSRSAWARAATSLACALWPLMLSPASPSLRWPLWLLSAPRSIFMGLHLRIVFLSRRCSVPRTCPNFKYAFNGF
jgi:hypothetical protein